MKYISTILGILSLGLIGVLFYLHFTHVEKLNKVSVTAERNAHTNFKVAYFDIDTLQEHYEYFKTMSGDIKKKESSMNAELNDLGAQYQNLIRKWQAKGNSITQAESETAQREVGMMQQRIQERKAALEQDLQRRQVDGMQEVRKEIEQFLKEYNKSKGYAYILSYEPGLIIYYKDSTYDITRDIIAGLNSRYKEKKK